MRSEQVQQIEDLWNESDKAKNAEIKELRCALGVALNHIQAHDIDCCPKNYRFAEWGKSTYETIDRVLSRIGLKIAFDENGYYDHHRNLIPSETP